jgi:hypothetical protein
MRAQAEELRPNVVLHSHGHGLPQPQPNDHSIAPSSARGLLRAPGPSAQMMPPRSLLEAFGLTQGRMAARASALVRKAAS